MLKMSPKAPDLRIAKIINKQLQQKLGKKLLSVIVYGSYARGTAGVGSDLDLLLLMTQRPTLDSPEQRMISELTYRYLDSDGLVVSAVPYSLIDYRKWRNYSPVLYWVEREGVRL